MAIRLHLTAVRQSNLEELRKVYTEILGPAFADIPIREENGWLWFTTSVWGVKVSDLIKGLTQLEVPGLNITSEDGSRWYLGLFGNGLEPTYLLHDFSYLNGNPMEVEEMDDDDEEEVPEPIDPQLAFLEDDPLPPGPPRIPFDQVIDYYADMGNKPTAEPFRPLAVGLPLSEAFRRFVRWHAENVADALQARGFSFDRDRMTAVLRQEPPYVRQFDGDLGNLPWFVVELQMKGDWQEIVDRWANMEAGQAEPEEENACPISPETMEDVHYEIDDEDQALIQQIQQWPAVALEGGALIQPLTVIGELQFIADAISDPENENVKAWCIVDLPSQAVASYALPARGKDDCSQVKTHLQDGRLVAYITNPYAWSRFGFDNKDTTGPFYRLLHRLPDGSRLCYLTGIADMPESQHRYEGIIQGKKWSIQACHPAVTTDTLRDVIELLRKRQEGVIHCHNELEAEAVMQAVQKDDYLHNMGVQRNGLDICLELDYGALTKLLLRERYKHAWDYTQTLKRLEIEYRTRLQEERKARKQMVQLAKQMAAPHEPQPLLKGCTTYWASDWDHFDSINNEVRTRVEAGMNVLQFRHLGDIVLKLMRNDIRRCWISPEGFAYASSSASRFGIYLLDFYTVFEDGSSLTTTTHVVDSRPEVGVYYKSIDWGEIPDMYAKHQWGIQRFLQHKQTKPLRHADSLMGLVIAYDAFLKRYGPVPKTEIVVEQIELDEPDDE